MRIKITNGIYGYKPNGSKFVTPVRAGECVAVSDEEAARLVSMRVAAYADDGGAEVVVPGVATPAGGVDGGEQGDNPAASENGSEDEKSVSIVDGHFDAEDLMAMTKANLLKLADDLGADVSKCKNKTEIVAVLTAIDVEPGDDGETPPVLNADDPVV